MSQWRQGEGLSIGTVKNRMAALRWWAQKVDRRNVIARSNDHYGIPERAFREQRIQGEAGGAG